MTEGRETGAKHIVKALHRSINDKTKTSSLPSKLFIQGDNNCRKNKNRYFFGYVECLVSWGVFSKMEVAF